MLKSFPLLILVLILYNLIVFGGGAAGQPDMSALMAQGVTVHMFSGDPWIFRLGDLIVLVGLGLLFVEVIKSTRTGAIEVINHALSMLVFIIALVEFIVLKGFSTSAFFFIVVMTLFDVVAGFTISIVAAKRDLGVAGGLIGTN